MKPLNDHLRFIELRSEGYSFRKIASLLNLSKDTCQSWNKLYENEIKELYQDKLSELINKYSLSKANRILDIGKTLLKINNTIDKSNFDTIELIDLLELKLKYHTILKRELINSSLDVDNIDNNEVNILNNSLTAKNGNNERSVIIEIINAQDDDRIRLLEESIIKSSGG